jgi:chromosome partitioning protein
VAIHTVLNQKGGVGKSTLTMNLAAVKNDAIKRADDEIAPVLAVSIDPQGSAVWWAERVDDLPFMVADAATEGEISRVAGMAGLKHIYVDTPGWIGDRPGSASNGLGGALLDEALDVTDLVIIPIPPEPLAFQPTVRTIREVVEPRGLPFILVVNNWDPRDGQIDLEQTQDFIRGLGWGDHLAETVIRRYKVHTRAAAQGVLVTEYNPNRATLEARKDFDKLSHEISERI